MVSNVTNDQGYFGTPPIGGEQSYSLNPLAENTFIQAIDLNDQETFNKTVKNLELSKQTGYLAALYNDKLLPDQQARFEILLLAAYADKALPPVVTDLISSFTSPAVAQTYQYSGGLNASVLTSKAVVYDPLIKSALNSDPFLKLFPEMMFYNNPVLTYSGLQPEVIIEQGNWGKNAYVILEGEVQVEILDSAGQVTKTIILDAGMVGEQSLITGELTNARVKALPNSRLLQIPAEKFLLHYNNLTQSGPVKELFEQFPFSPELTKQILAAKGISLKVCHPGEVPLLQESTSKNMYLLLDGKLGVFDTFGEITYGDGKPVEIKAGEALGEISLLTNEPKSASAINNSGQDVILLKLPKATFEQLYESNAEFQSYIDKQYAERVARSAQDTELTKLNELGFDYQFDSQLDHQVKTKILLATQAVYKQLLTVNPNLEPARAKTLLTFICQSLESQHLRGRPVRCVHGPGDCREAEIAVDSGVLGQQDCGPFDLVVRHGMGRPDVFMVHVDLQCG